MNAYLGTCPCCGREHSLAAPGAVRLLGGLGSLAVALRSRNAGPAFLLALAHLAFADRIELWLRARCPECGALLEILRTVS